MIDLIDNIFERLTVLKRVDNDKLGHLRWLCLCDCGKERVVFGFNLKNGHTKSCGCLKIERAKTHDMYGTPTYRSWDHMNGRCSNPNDKEYKDYGGLGITFAERWDKFENFLEDMGEQPKGLQIDRIENDGNYCKSNCRWVTPKQNSRNKRNNIFITHNGKKKCISEWSEEFDIRTNVVWMRLELGWSTEKALTTPVRKYKKRKPK